MTNDGETLVPTACRRRRRRRPLVPLLPERAFLPHFILVLLVLLAPPLSHVHGCSRVLWSQYNDEIVVSARSMDWSFSFDDYLYVIPRGVALDGGIEEEDGDDDDDDGVEPAKWTCKYGSVVSSISGWTSKHGFDFVNDGATDGMNEMGLAVHVLYLEATEYPDRQSDSDKPAVSYLRWARYLLDNFANVAEAVEGMKDVRILAMPIAGHVLGAHVAIEDQTGDSAVFEIIGGELKVYHDKKALVMTNDPPYDEQLELLSEYEGFGGTLRLPGSTSSEDRFVRLSYYLPYLPEPKDDVEAVASVHSLIMNAAVPFGAPYGDDVYPTWWTSVCDLTDGVYYFNWLKNPFIVWVELEKLDFSEGNTVKVLNPRDPTLLGEVSSFFVEAGAFQDGPIEQRQEEEEAAAAAKRNMGATTDYFMHRGASFRGVGTLLLVSVSVFLLHKRFVTRTGSGSDGTEEAIHPTNEGSPLFT